MFGPPPQGDPAAASPPSRIHIVGGEATGKTTLSRAIGAIIGAPVHNLDAVAWIVGESTFDVLDPLHQPSAAVVDRPLEDRLRMVGEIASEPAWVTEGKYLGWTEQLLERSDLIVFLDHVPTWRAMVHIVARAGRSAIREARRQSGGRRFLRLRDYARHSVELAGQLARRVTWGKGSAGRGGRAGDSDTRAATLAALAPYRDKTVHVRRRSDIDAFVERLTTGRRGAQGDRSAR